VNQAYELPTAEEFIAKFEPLLDLILRAAWWIPFKKQIKKICDKDNMECFHEHSEEIIGNIYQKCGSYASKDDIEFFLATVHVYSKGVLWIIMNLERRKLISGVPKKVMVEYIQSIEGDIREHLRKKAS
jgi:hypothetical protein